ncbi:MAG: hypothetical protein RL227_2942, partial [Pseudomonadota bacterium]
MNAAPNTRSRLGAAALAALMGLSSLAPAWAQTPNAVRLPALGEGASADLSVNQERRLGDAILRDGRRDPAVRDDPSLRASFQQLYAPL